ncbi:MAG: hypothetical protein H0W98_05680 [Chloroflexi bacterium]|nr:hypothetical protein [Chloroflexota bacterium]
MSQVGTVTRLALRELWITFRLLVVLVAFTGVGSVVALLPAPAAVSFERLAVGFGIATTVTSALAAWTLAEERASGRAGWLMTRSVSRGTYLLGWFGAIAAVTAVGLIGGATLGWLAASTTPLGLDATGYASVAFAILAATWAAIGLGLVAGTVAKPSIAAVSASAICSAVAAAGLLVPVAGSWTPAGAYLALPWVAGADAVLPAALRAAGIGLFLAAVLLAAARVAMERAEL